MVVGGTVEELTMASSALERRPAGIGSAKRRASLDWR
jgi:hypothetical protein